MSTVTPRRDIRIDNIDIETLHTAKASSSNAVAKKASTVPTMASATGDTGVGRLVRHVHLRLMNRGGRHLLILVVEDRGSPARVASRLTRQLVEEARQRPGRIRSRESILLLSASPRTPAQSGVSRLWFRAQPSQDVRDHFQPRHLLQRKGSPADRPGPCRSPGCSAARFADSSSKGQFRQPRDLNRLQHFGKVLPARPPAMLHSSA